MSYLPSQKVKNDICPGCKEPIIIVDATEPGQGVGTSPHRLDPTPITKAEEIGCVLIGRATWKLDERPLGFWRRDEWYFETYGPEVVHPVVVPAHFCGARFNTFWSPVVAAELPDAPPF